jgi:heterotetrameric sarcosine oxidase gamma subunit
MRVSAPESGVVLTSSEAQVCELAAFAGQASALAAAAEAHEHALPAHGRAQRCGAGVALCVRPARWLLLAPPAAAAPAWLGEVSALCAVLDASSALALYQLTGDGVRELLARGCRLDLSLRTFPPGTAAATIMAQVPVTLAAILGGMLLLTPASTARHVHEWLLASGRASGLTTRDDAIVPFFSGDLSP